MICEVVIREFLQKIIYVFLLDHNGTHYGY